MVVNTKGVNGAPWSENAHKIWSLVRSRWNMDDVRLHDLRRTCASYLAIQGENMQGLDRYLTFYNQTRPHRTLDGHTPEGVYFDNLPTRHTPA
jgi:transposase InsO family protein